MINVMKTFLSLQQGIIKPASFASQKPRKFHSCLESRAVESCATRTCVRARVIRKFHDKPA